MSKTKIKDDLTLLITGLVIVVIAWTFFRTLGMWVFYIYFLLILYVYVRRHLRTRKNRN